MSLRSEDPYIVLEVLDAQRVFLVTRKTTPLPSPDTLAQSVKSALTPLIATRDRWGVVYDGRASVGRNDAGFEASMSELERWAEQHFSRIVIVVATRVGELQVNRTKRDGKWRALIASDVEDAIRIASLGPTR
jgi:hypothetical protein